MVLLTKEKRIMSELHDSVDYNNLKFEHVSPTKDVSFSEYKDSEELFNAIKNSQIKFLEVKNKQKNLLIFLEPILKCCLMPNMMQNKMN